MTAPTTQLFLSVPFAQKDQAKTLGARWDAGSKAWWVPSDVDPTPFIRWLQLPQKNKPLYENLAGVDRQELDECGTRGQVEVVFVPWTCWKCNRTTVAFHGAIDRAQQVTHLLYQERVIEELEVIRKDLGLEPFGCIKPRFSRTLLAMRMFRKGATTAMHSLERILFGRTLSKSSTQ